MLTNINDESSRLLYVEAAQLAARLTPREGYNQTLISDVTVLRRSRSLSRSPVFYEPSIVFVVQGKKIDYLGNLAVSYRPGTVLVLSASMPFQCVLKASEKTPMLSVVVRLRQEVVLSILSSMQRLNTERNQEPKAIQTVTPALELLQTLVRLLHIAGSPDDTRVLGDQTVRELIYLVLKSEGGDGIRAMVGAGGASAQILSTLRRIHNDYSRPLLVADLARRAGMSVSAFHLHFRRVAATTPIQYIKAVRLHRARALLLRSGATAGSVAASVGYRSASQFGREFKRMFGETPAKHMARPHDSLPSDRPWQ